MLSIAKIKNRAKEFIVQLDHGDITQEDTQAIVNSACPGSGLPGGECSRAIFKTTKYHVENEYLRERRKDANADIMVTGAGQLVQERIFHIVANRNPNLMKDVVRRTLKKADEMNIQSITFPALGTGHMGGSESELVKPVLEAIRDFLQNDVPPVSLTFIKFVIYKQKDAEFTKNIFEEVFGAGLFRRNVTNEDGHVRVIPRQQVLPGNNWRPCSVVDFEEKEGNHKKEIENALESHMSNNGCTVVRLAHWGSIRSNFHELKHHDLYIRDFVMVTDLPLIILPSMIKFEIVGIGQEIKTGWRLARTEEVEAYINVVNVLLKKHNIKLEDCRFKGSSSSKPSKQLLIHTDAPDLYVERSTDFYADDIWSKDAIRIAKEVIKVAHEWCETRKVVIQEIRDIAESIERIQKYSDIGGMVANVVFGVLAGLTLFSGGSLSPLLVSFGGIVSVLGGVVGMAKQPLTEYLKENEFKRYETFLMKDMESSDKFHQIVQKLEEFSEVNNINPNILLGAAKLESFNLVFTKLVTLVKTDRSKQDLSPLLRDIIPKATTRHRKYVGTLVVGSAVGSAGVMYCKSKIPTMTQFARGTCLAGMALNAAELVYTAYKLAQGNLEESAEILKNLATSLEESLQQVQTSLSDFELKPSAYEQRVLHLRDKWKSCSNPNDRSHPVAINEMASTLQALINMRCEREYTIKYDVAVRYVTRSLIPELKSRSCSKSGDYHLDITIVAHGGILEKRMKPCQYLPFNREQDEIVLYQLYGTYAIPSSVTAVVFGLMNPECARYKPYEKPKKGDIQKPSHLNKFSGQSTQMIPEIAIAPYEGDHAVKLEKQLRRFANCTGMKGRIFIPWSETPKGSIPLYIITTLIQMIVESFSTSDKKFSFTYHNATCLSPGQSKPLSDTFKRELDEAYGFKLDYYAEFNPECITDLTLQKCLINYKDGQLQNFLKVADKEIHQVHKSNKSCCFSR